MVHSARRRLRLAAPALAAAALLAVTGCGSDSSDAAAPQVSATTAPPASAPTGAGTPSSTPTADTAQVIAVTVANGQVTGPQARTDVKLGTKVRITVTSDKADVLHVHGYELEQPITVGQPAQLEFTADKAGVFEVELHKSDKVITRLQVQ